MFPHFVQNKKGITERILASCEKRSGSQNVSMLRTKQVEKYETGPCFMQNNNRNTECIHTSGITKSRIPNLSTLRAKQEEEF